MLGELEDSLIVISKQQISGFQLIEKFIPGFLIWSKMDGFISGTRSAVSESCIVINITEVDGNVGFEESLKLENNPHGCGVR